MLFRYCVPKAVSSTEFYPIPYYESVYLENQCFTIEADSQYQADEKAYRFLANLQKKHDLAYEKLLDEQGIRFRKREEIIERRPIYLRDLRRPGDLDTFGSQKDPKVWNAYRLNDYYRETELPENFQVSGYRYEQNPSGGQYRFFRQLTDHQFAYGLVFLLIVVLLILLLPQFRGLGMLDVLNLD